jgi:hypothetical protein
VPDQDAEKRSRYRNGIKLHGVLYLHRISDNRMDGIARRDFGMFKHLVGENNFKNVIIVTTMWDRTPHQYGINNVEQLRTDPSLFKPVLDRGAPMMHHLKIPETAQEIVQRIMTNNPLPLEIQIELVDQSKDISQTAAYKEGVSSESGVGSISVTRGGSGFPVGSYFVIRERGTNNCLTTCAYAGTEGIQVQLWPQQTNSSQVCTYPRNNLCLMTLVDLALLYRRDWSTLPWWGWARRRHCW